MRIAIPLGEDGLASHVGRCREFALVDVDPHTGIVQGRRWTSAPTPGRGRVPKWLADQGAQVIIAGGMERRTRGLLADRGIRVVVDAPAETPGRLVAAYLAGRLQPGAEFADL